MGGYQAGDIASQLIIDRLRKWERTYLGQSLGYKNPRSLIKRKRREIFYESHQRSIVLGKKDSKAGDYSYCISFI